jgi:hypothetical protein
MADKALAEELEKLRKLQQEGILGSIKDGENVNAQLNMPGGTQVISEVSNSSSRIMTRKRSRLSASVSQDDAMQREAAKNLSKETMYSNAVVNVQQVYQLILHTLSRNY